MGDAWMPGAVHLPASADGGEPRGGAPRAVWLTLETDPRLVSAMSAAERADQAGRAPHLVWNPLTGEIVQLIPVLRAGRALGHPDGPVHTGASPPGESPAINREGRHCVQIAVISFAAEPFTAGPMTDLERIVWWLDSWYIPRSWPAGPPPPSARAHGAPRSRRLWAHGGHFGASQVPCCTAAGPGAVDIGRLIDPATIPAIGVPRRARETVPSLREAPAARGVGTAQFGLLHQPGDNEAQLSSTG